MGSPRDGSQQGLFQSTRETTGQGAVIKEMLAGGQGQVIQACRLWQELSVGTTGAERHRGF